MLDGKVALVTGSASWDLGSMVALALAKNGVDIVLNLSPTDPNRTARLEPKLSELCQKIEEMNRQATLLKTPTVDADGVKRMIREISSKHHSVDILVNNGGGGLTITDIAKTPVTRRDRFKMLKRETHSAINCTVECLPLMCDNRWGRVINIGFSSILVFFRRAQEMAQIGGREILRETKRNINFPRAHLFSENAQVLYFHKRIIDKRKYDITINSVGLGENYVEHWDDVYDATDGFQRALSLRDDVAEWSLRRHCTPQDVAEAVLFLCSEQARFITDAEIRFSSE